MKLCEDHEKEARTWGTAAAALDELIHRREAEGWKAPIDLVVLQDKILRALYRPFDSSYTLKDSEVSNLSRLCPKHTSTDWGEFKYDIDNNNNKNTDFANFERAVEGRDEYGKGVDIKGGAFSHPTFEAMGVRKWLFPALGFLGAVGPPERRRTVYRLLLAYVLDPLDPEKPSIFGKDHLTGGAGPCLHEACVAKALRNAEKEKEANPDTTEGKCKLCQGPVEGPQKLVDAENKCKLCAKEVKKKKEEDGDPRSHMRSSVAVHALAAILRGRGFSLDQRFAAVRVVLGPPCTLKSLQTSDWASLALDSLKNTMTRSGISPIQVRRGIIRPTPTVCCERVFASAVRRRAATCRRPERGAWSTWDR